MTVLVIGATSQIGHFLLPRVVGRGDQVIALSRNAPTSPQLGIHWLQGELPGRVPETGPLDAVISFGPLDGVAEWLARSCPPDLARVVATSSMSAESKRDSSVASDRRLSQRLRDGEQRLIEVCERYGIRWTILRPTLIYGAGLDRSLTPIVKRAVRWRVFPVLSARGLRQPVHADDVAMAALRAMETPAAANRVFALGGGERLPVGELFARVRDSVPVATLPVPVPMSVLALAATLHSSLRGPVTRLEVDLIADNLEVKRILGLEPRAFHPTIHTWGLHL